MSNAVIRPLQLETPLSARRPHRIGQARGINYGEDVGDDDQYWRDQMSVKQVSETLLDSDFRNEPLPAPPIDEALIDHRYGGPWTDIKLDALQGYLTFFTSALKNQPIKHRPFELWYLDAFAGSGDRVVERKAGGLFDGEVTHFVDERLDGSAKKALEVDPPFQRLVFIEPDRSRHAALVALKVANPHRDVECIRDDGNTLVRAICGADHWRTPISEGGRRVRAVLLLDPYGMQVDWTTLEAIRRTKAIDLLYLYPIGAVMRQAARDLSKVDADKAAALTRLHGDDSWRCDWYEVSRQQDLLSRDPCMLRAVTARQIEAWFKARLETLFPFVSEPPPLLTPRGAKLFSLFLAVSNDSPAAVALAKKAVASIMRPRRTR
jgi:three-Cys-motif partner protein